MKVIINTPSSNLNSSVQTPSRIGIDGNNVYIAYASDVNGSDFSLTPNDLTYIGVLNTDEKIETLTAADFEGLWKKYIGDNGDAFEYSDFTPEQLAALKGATGKSAYQSYLDTTDDDPPLTESEWAVYSKEQGDYANEKAVLADTKASLADSKATLADSKATLADNAATSANTAATNANNAANAVTAAINSQVIEARQPVINKDTVLSTGDGQARLLVTSLLDGFSLVGIIAEVNGASTSGLPTYQIRKEATSEDMLSTKLSINVGQKDSTNATTPVVINPIYRVVHTGEALLVDVDIAGTNTLGTTIIYQFQKL